MPMHTSPFMAFVVTKLCVLMPNCNLPVQGYMLR